MSEIDIRKVYYFGKEEDWLVYLLEANKIKKLYHGIKDDELKLLDAEASKIKSKLKTLLPDLDPDSANSCIGRVLELLSYKIRNT